jgi:hypothetical protein
MAHITPPPLPGKTVLEKIGDKFKDISDDFYTLYDVLKDVWLLGTYLRWPFYWLYMYFQYVANKFYQADDLVRELKRWIDGITEGYTFRDLLYWLSSHFRSITTDATGWVRYRIESISTSMWRLINTPHVFVFGMIEDWVTWFYAFRTDPKQTVINWLTDRYPWLSQFLYNALSFIVSNVFAGVSFLRDLRDNPQNTIINWLAYWYSWIRTFLSDPLNYIVGRVKAFRTDIAFFFDNPIAWAKEKIKQVMGWTDYDISDIAYFVLKRVLNNAIAYVNREYPLVRQRVCDIIMMFM